MMKKCVVFLMLLCLLASALPGHGEGIYYITGMQDDSSRLKLRKAPSTNSEILGQFFGDVAVTVHSVSGEWAKVDIGGLEGYMMREFLAPVSDGQWHFQGNPGSPFYVDENGRVPLYAAPNVSSAKIAEIGPESGGVRVLGTINDDWLYVLIEQPDGSTLYGYGSSLDITQSDNYATATVDGNGQTVNIREEPSLDAAILGEYFSGVVVRRLFDNHMAGDGWDKVRVGSVVGYMKEDYLDYSSAGVFPWRAPMAELKEHDCAIWDYALDSTIDLYTPFCILGRFGDRYQVRCETWLDEANCGYAYGFISVDSVKTKPQRSVSTRGVTKEDTFLYSSDQEGNLTAWQEVPKGTQVMISHAIGETVPSDGFFSEYVYPEAAYLSVEVSLSAGSLTYGYLPIDAVSYDPGLNYPESMTLG